MSVSGATMCYPLRSEAPERLAAAASNCHFPEQLMQGHRAMADPMGESTACRASKGIAGDQTRNHLRSKKTGPELGRLRHPWYNCTAFSISRHSWLDFLALIYCARRRRLLPGHATARLPGPR